MGSQVLFESSGVYHLAPLDILALVHRGSLCAVTPLKAGMYDSFLPSIGYIMRASSVDRLYHESLFLR